MGPRTIPSTGLAAWCLRAGVCRRHLLASTVGAGSGHTGQRRDSSLDLPHIPGPHPGGAAAACAQGQGFSPVRGHVRGLRGRVVQAKVDTGKRVDRLQSLSLPRLNRRGATCFWRILQQRLAPARLSPTRDRSVPPERPVAGPRRLSPRR